MDLSTSVYMALYRLHHTLSRSDTLLLDMVQSFKVA